MSKFKVGDKVVMSSDYYSNDSFKEGQICKITRITECGDCAQVENLITGKSRQVYISKLLPCKTELVTKESSYTIKLSEVDGRGMTLTLQEDKAKQLRDELNTLLGE